MGDKDEKGVRRGNRRSSWAQSHNKNPEDRVNEAVSKIQMSVKEGTLDPKHATEGAPPIRPPDRKEMGMTAEALVELQKVFKAAEENEGSGLLDQESFLKTCVTIKTLIALMSEEQLKHLFMKIDANNKGEIGFDDFTSYLLSQQFAKENEPAAEHTTFVRVTTFGSKRFGRSDYEDSESAPSDEEERRADDEVWFTPGPQKRGDLKIGEPGNIIEKIMLLGPLNVYVTASQDGMLKLWSSDTLKPMRAIQNGSGAWITDMVVMAQQPMAVFALDRSVTFYDTGRMSFDCLGRITALENAPMCATWLRVAENDKLLFGDELGILHTYTFNDEWGGERPREGFGVSDKKLPPGMSENIPWVLHNDWMTSIKYLSHSNSLITTGMDSCLLMLDFEKRQMKWSGKEHANGIYACDYCRCFFHAIALSLKH
ncbi:hypothetical protein M758_3G002600 [Ceratodon purpureus]|nr:hypothetical protein M758_3G002600 [Ceratodon purpureus]